MFAVGNGYNVQNNGFNLQGATQCINVDSGGTDWNVTSNANVSTTGAPSGYPSIYSGCHWGTCSHRQSGMPVQESAITTSPTTWNVTPSPNGNWDIAYDIWFNPNTTTNNNSTGLELMVWINHNGTIQPAGSVVASNLSVGGATWNIWRSGSTQNSGTISYVRTSATSSFNFDLVSIYHDIVNRGWLSSNRFLIDVEAGTEIWTAGSGFATNSFTICVNNASTCPGGGGGTTIPPAPTNLSASTVSSTQINLSWTASSGATSYSVFRSTTSGFSPSSSNQIASGVTATSFMDTTGLQASTTYFFLVEACNSAGCSGPSNQASATTQSSGCGGPPPAPTNLSAAAASSSQINLTWNASSGATSYSIFRSTSSGFTAGSGNLIKSGDTSTSFSDTNLTPSTMYFYVVEAVSSCGSSVQSNQASATTLANTSSSTDHTGTFSLQATLSGMPTYSNTYQVANVASNANYNASIWLTGTGSVFLYVKNGNWGSTTLASANCTATSNWTQCSTPTFSTGSNTQLTYILQDNFATAGTVYLDDAALGVAGQTNALANPSFESGNANWSITNSSVWSIGQFSGSCGVPAAPSGLTAAAASASQINLSWTASTCASTYSVFRGTTSGFTPGSPVASGITGTTFNDTGLSPSTTFFYLVEAVDSAGSSAASNHASTTTQAACTPPNPPSNLMASAPSSSQVNLSWTASSTPGATYIIYRSTTSGFSPGVSTEIAHNISSASFSDTGLNPSTTYFYLVEAQVSCGDVSSATNQASTTTQAATSPNVHTGTWSLRGALPSSQNYSNVSQVTSAASNSTYVASLWIRLASGTGSVQLEIKAGSWGSNLTSVQCAASSTWSQCTAPSFSTGSNTLLTFIVQDTYGGAATVYVDDAFLGPSGGGNVLANPGFESGNTNWSVSNSSTWAIGQF